MNDAKDLTNLSATDATAMTTLTNIYKMFAASGNDFSNNNEISTASNKPAKTKWWLQANVGNPTFTPKNNSTPTTPTNFTSTLNGITWKAEITSPAISDPFEEEAATGKLPTAKTVTITRTVDASQTLKYKYTGTDGTLTGSGSGTWTLPSNIKTIKITLIRRKLAKSNQLANN